MNGSPIYGKLLICLRLHLLVGVVALLVAPSPANACKTRLFPKRLPAAEIEGFRHIYVIRAEKIVPTDSPDRWRYGPPFSLKATVIKSLKGPIESNQPIRAKTTTDAPQAGCPIQLEEGAEYLVFMNGNKEPFEIPRYGSLYVSSSSSHFKRYVAQLQGPKITDGPLVILNQCGVQKSCVTMDLNLKNNKRRSKVVIKKRPLANDFTAFSLQLTSHLGNRRPRKQEVVFKSYTGGISCTDFGQGRAAVLGFSAPGQPVLLTNRGPLHVASGQLRMGCEACIKLIDKTSFKTILFPSRSWNTPSGALEQISFDAAGKVYIREGPACVSVGANQWFQAVESKKCAAKKSRTNDPVYSHGSPRKNELIFKAKANPFYLSVKTGACT